MYKYCFLSSALFLVWSKKYYPYGLDRIERHFNFQLSATVFNFNKVFYNSTYSLLTECFLVSYQTVHIDVGESERQSKIYYRSHSLLLVSIVNSSCLYRVIINSFHWLRWIYWLCFLSVTPHDFCQQFWSDT